MRIEWIPWRNEVHWTLVDWHPPRPHPDAREFGLKKIVPRDRFYPTLDEWQEMIADMVEYRDKHL